MSTLKRKHIYGDLDGKISKLYTKNTNTYIKKIGAYYPLRLKPIKERITIN